VRTANLRATDRRSEDVVYRYRRAVLEELLRHGVRPADRTPPPFVRSFVNDLYRFEIRRLRARLLRGDIARPSYAAHVIELRARYPLLSLDARFWTEPDA
jgi:hypothetical protein